MLGGHSAELSRGQNLLLGSQNGSGTGGSTGPGKKQKRCCTKWLICFATFFDRSTGKFVAFFFLEKKSLE
jgi:hypothetical protein